MHVMSRTTTFATIATIAALASVASFVTIAHAARGGAADGAAARPTQAGGQRPAARPAPQPPFVKPAATFLGMTPAAVMKALKSGTLTALAEAKGKSVEDLEAAIIADAKTKLAKDVAAERIDQDEADAKLADLEARIGDIVSKPLPARGAGGTGNCPNRPGGAGGADGASGAAPAPSTDTTTGGAAAGGYGDAGGSTTAPATTAPATGTYL